MTNIFLKVNGASVTASVDGKVTSGMVGLPVSIQYDESWNNLIKTAFFRVGNQVRKRDSIEKSTTIPWEILRNHGKTLEIGIEGRDADGNIVMPTVWASVATVYQGASGDIPAAPNPDAEDVPSGGGGSPDAVRYTSQTLTPEQQAQARENIGATITNQETITVYLGDELIDTTVLPTLGTNWSGDYENGFHHASGSTSSLSFEDYITDVNCDYILEFDTDYTSDEFVNVGFDDSYKILAYNGTSHITLPLRATSKALRFTPHENRDFTISNISLKKIQSQGTKKELVVDSILSKNSVSNYGFWNVILGADTMENAVGSTRCIAIGRAALSQLQGGHRNIGIGTFSMSALTGGEKNISIGADSMFSAETGEKNIVIGFAAMPNATGATTNIAIGHKALNCAVGGTPVSNIAIGEYTGNYLTTGENNIMLGNNAGYSITSGKRNICIGHTAKGAKTGNYNVCIGDNSGYSDGVAQSTAIGFKAVATASHQVVIGKANDEVILGGRRLIFNDDGTVTWETVT